MLAEPRSRQKWSQDPRNTNWANDTSKFGYQMLEKMGWSEGKGLGQKLTGNTTHVRVKKNVRGAGIGSKKSHDDDWIAHQNDFNDLLSSLNQGGDDSTSKMSSLENRVKTSKKKILYKRFIKSKDLSNASAHDLACIFGKRSQSAPVTPQISDDEKDKSELESIETSCPTNIDNDEENSVKTIESTLSIADYFAQKMAALQKKKNNVESTTNNDNNTNKINDVENSSSISNIEPVETEDSSIKKKKKKKRKIEEVEETNEEEIKDELVLENGLVKKKKKKKIEKIESETSVVETIEQPVEENEIKKKKKKKNSEIVETDETEVVSKKKKKKKSEKADIEEISELLVENQEADEVTKKKKKKKKKQVEE